MPTPKFEFNKHGVCTNPEQIPIYKSKRDSAQIELAQTKTGYWCVGYDFNCYTGGSSCAPGVGEYRTTYLTREKALLAGLDRGITWAKYYETWPDPRPLHYGRFRKALEAYKTELVSANPFISIDGSQVSMTPDSPILEGKNQRIVIKLELRTMKLLPHFITYTDEFDRLCNLPKPERLADLIALVLRRQHPRFEYIAQQHGVRVCEYQELPTFRQSMSSIVYEKEADGTITMHV